MQLQISLEAIVTVFEEWREKKNLAFAWTIKFDGFQVFIHQHYDGADRALLIWKRKKIMTTEQMIVAPNPKILLAIQGRPKWIENFEYSGSPTYAIFCWVHICNQY